MQLYKVAYNAIIVPVPAVGIALGNTDKTDVGCTRRNFGTLVV